MESRIIKSHQQIEVLIYFLVLTPFNRTSKSLRLSQILRLDKYSLYSIVILCPFALVCTFLFVLLFYQYRELRIQPGDIILLISLSSFGFFLTFFLIAIFNFQYQRSPLWDSNFCQILACTTIFTSTLNYCYNCYFCVYVVNLIKNSLKRRTISQFLIHSTSILVSTGYTYFNYYYEFTGLSLSGTCSYGINQHTPYLGLSISFLYSFIALFTLIYYGRKFKSFNIFRFFRKTQNVSVSKTSQQIKVSGIQRRFGRFLMISVCFTGFGYIIVQISHLMLLLNCRRYYSNVIYIIFGVIGHIIEIILPLLLILMRMSDPFIKAQIVELFTRRAPGGFDSRDSFNKLLDNPYTTSQSVNRVNIIFSIVQRIHLATDENFQLQIQSQREFERDGQSSNYGQQKKADILNHSFSKTMEQSQVDLIQNRNKYQSQLTGFQEKDFKDHFVIQSEKKDLFDQQDDEFQNFYAEGDFQIHSPQIFQCFRLMDRHIISPSKAFDLRENHIKIINQFGAGSKDEGQGGASGQFFYFTADQSMIMQTLKEEEMTFYLENIDRFFNYFQKNPKSLISQFYGLYTWRHQDFEIFICIMKNISNYSSLLTISKFDLKGSTMNRTSIERKKQKKQPKVLKARTESQSDQKICSNQNQNSEICQKSLMSEFEEAEIQLPPNLIDENEQFIQKLKKHSYLVMQDTDYENLGLVQRLDYDSYNVEVVQYLLNEDIEFLHGLNRMDYSLILFLVNVERSDKSSLQNPALDNQTDHSCIPTKMISKNKKKKTSKKLIVNIGIIDYLQEWNFSQMLQRFAQIIQYCSCSIDISAVDATRYRNRFSKNVIDQIFRSNGQNDEIQNQNSEAHPKIHHKVDQKKHKIHSSQF